MNKPKTNEKATRNPRELVLGLIESFGENPNRDGLKETPDRVVKMYSEVLGGYSVDPSSVFKLFECNGYKNLVTVANIDFYSLCEHHMVPFFGKVHIGYIPNGKVLGLSKFARLVDIYAKRLQTQENLTNQIAKDIEKYLKPKGYIVHIEAEHLCVSMRGIKRKGFLTKTTKSQGLLRKAEYVEQFYRDIDKQ